MNYSQEITLLPDFFTLPYQKLRAWNKNNSINLKPKGGSFTIS